MGEPAAPVAGPTQPSDIVRCATSMFTSWMWFEHGTKRREPSNALVPNASTPLHMCSARSCDIVFVSTRYPVCCLPIWNNMLFGRIDGATDEMSLSPPGKVLKAPVRCIAGELSNRRTLSPKLLPLGLGLPVATYTLPCVSIDAPPGAQIAPRPEVGVTLNATLPCPATSSETNQP